MEHRNHARVAVNLKATLLDDQAMLLGCRVKDVSRGGMLLQHERYDKDTTFQEGDTVEARVSLRQGDERKVIPLSMTVRRIEEYSIATEFLRPQSELMMLVEIYRLDKEETQEAAANQGLGEIRAANTANPLSASASARASRRRFAVQRARLQFAEPMKTAREPAAEIKQPTLGQTLGDNAVTGKANRRLFYIGLLSLVTAAGILLLDFIDRKRTENRISTLESAIGRQANALTLLRARLSPSDARTRKLTELNARMETLTTPFAALETRITQDAGQITALSTTATAGTPGTLASVRQPVNDKPATDAQSQGISNDGPWVINLLSLDDKTEANRFTEKARTRGIRADTNPVTVKGEQIWRVQVNGFSTRDHANAYADTSKRKLGLNSVWVFKKGR